MTSARLVLFFLQRDSLNSRSTGCHTFSQMGSENALTVRLSTGSINNHYEFKFFLSVTLPLYFLLSLLSTECHCVSFPTSLFSIAVEFFVQ